MDIASKLYVAGLGFLLTLIFGFWMSRQGKPYHGLLFNFHKLIALGTVILTFMAVNQLRKTLDFESLVRLSLVIAGLSVVVLFASGAFMSAGKGEYQVMKRIHNIAPILMIAGLGVTLYLLGGKI